MPTKNMVSKAVLCLIFVLCMGKSSVATTQSASDYYDFPMASVTTLPNILVFFDVSASMTAASYSNFSGTSAYFGIFSNNQTCNSGAGAKYSYDSGNGYFYLDTNGPWSDPFLNYATMNEIDVAKVVFTGGVTYPASSITSGVASYPGRNNITGGTRGTPGVNVLSGVGGITQTVANLPAGNVPSTYNTSSVTINGGNGTFTASYTGGSDATTYNIRVKKDSSNSCESAGFVNGDVAGVIQKMKNAARWGLAKSNVAGGGNDEIPEPIVGAGYSQTYLANVTPLHPVP